MKVSNLDRGEIVAMVGGVIFAIAVFLPWYSTGNQFASLNGHHGAGLHVSAWNALSIMRYFLLAAAVAPAILAYIIVREHALSWPRGELTAVVAITAVTLVLVRGLILKPGEPSGQISLDYGWFVALGAGILILVGALIRTGESDRGRKPPGVL
jgi:predicted transporter